MLPRGASCPADCRHGAGGEEARRRAGFSRPSPRPRCCFRAAASAYDLKELLETRADPAKAYLTFQTDHFEVHCPSDLEPVARDVARAAERARANIDGALGVDIARTHIVVLHQSDQPRIFTMVHPLRLVWPHVLALHDRGPVADVGSLRCMTTFVTSGPTSLRLATAALAAGAARVAIDGQRLGTSPHLPVL